MNMPYGESSWFDYTPVGFAYNYLFGDEVSADSVQFAPASGGSSKPLIPDLKTDRLVPYSATVPDPGKTGLPPWVGPTVFGVSLLVLVGVLMGRKK